VVDFDGEQGRATYRKWISQYGAEWTKTRTVETSQGGHVWFLWPDGETRIRNSVRKIAPGIDVRGEGGFVVVPPSIHPTGKAYTFTDPAAPILEAPSWLLDLISNASPESREKANGHAEGTIPNGQRNARLTSLAGSMRRRGMDPGAILAALHLHNTSHCDPPLDEGEVQRIATSVGRYEPAHDLVTEDGLALIFADLHQANWRYVFLWNKWLEYCGVWRHDESLKVFDLSREITRGASIQCTKKEDATAKWLRSAKTVAAVLRLAQCDSRIAAVPDQFDADLWQFNTDGGTVELKDGTLREYRAADYLTKIATVAPKISDTPVWNAFLDRVTAGDVELQRYLQRVAGYCLTGDIREHALFFLYGTGANGKGTFTNTLLGIWGNYGQTAAMEMLTESKTERHPTELAALRGARLVVASETNASQRWNETRIKMLTGGDTVRARFMHCNEFEFMPAFKLMIQGNHKPGLHTVDEAIRRRLHLVPFTITIPVYERDEKLKEKLRPEWPGILQWAINGCMAWQREGLNPPEAVRNATQEYFATEDALRTWMDERCIVSPQAGSAKTSMLYQDFKAWAERTGEPSGSQKRFSQQLRDHGFKTYVSNGVRFEGISIRESDAK
jgi:putative DNA primase/helicase